MEQSLSEKISDTIDALITEVNDTNKEFVTERITAGAKKDQIDCSTNIAKYRVVNAVKTATSDLLVMLKKERINPTTVERVKQFLNEKFQ